VVSAARPAPPLPHGVHFEQRPFPDSNLLLLGGREPALIDSGFVGHVGQTAAWVRTRTSRLTRVVNTHWHADHVGGNAHFQARGARIAGFAGDAEALARRDPGCCAAERLDQPVDPYTVDEPLRDGAVLHLGDLAWQVVHTPGHTRGHGDALSDRDVGWVDLTLDGPDAALTALDSLERLRHLGARTLLPAHGPVPVDADASFESAVRRARRLVDDPDGAIWYGARRILGYALMIRDGLPVDAVEPYLQERAWIVDAARWLSSTPEEVSTELVGAMSRSGALVVRSGRLCTAADYEPVPTESLTRHRFPRQW
jgi:glyoxylase-like metal-dependent hydrolase (beta-lactamase superfamily II)